MLPDTQQGGKRPPAPTAAPDDAPALRPQLVPLDDIRLDGTQTRARLSDEAVRDYADAYLAGEQMPPVVLFRDGPYLWMGDGFHRYEAANRAEMESIPAAIRDGTQRDALLYSAGANATHGLRRTAEDKRQAVRMLLQDEEWRHASNRWIAEKCRVSDHTVASVREEIESEGVGHAGSNGQSGGEAARRAQTRTSRNGESENSETRTDQAGRQQPAKKRKKKAAKPAPAEVKDALGNAVPGHLRDVFADTQLAEMVAELEGIQAQFKPEPWVEKAGKLCDHHGFILIDKFRGHLYDGLARLQLATEALIAGLPYAVCPKCQGVDSNKDGKTCRGCRGFGAVPKHRYEELTSA